MYCVVIFIIFDPITGAIYDYFGKISDRYFGENNSKTSQIIRSMAGCIYVSSLASIQSFIGCYWPAESFGAIPVILSVACHSLCDTIKYSAKFILFFGLIDQNYQGAAFSIGNLFQMCAALLVPIYGQIVDNNLDGNWDQMIKILGYVTVVDTFLPILCIGWTLYRSSSR